jgi:hypothetical protein
MPEQPRLTKAMLQGIQWIDGGKRANPVGSPFDVQFNPQTLKVSYTNQSAGGKQPQGAATQYVGKATTRLTAELWFDTTVSETSGTAGSVRDVRDSTARVSFFLQPGKRLDQNGKEVFVPPGLRFHWGQFMFDGVLDSMDETLELFSEGGVPTRASVSISMSRQEIPLRSPSSTAPIGTQPLEAPRSGDSVQQVAARAGQSDWQGVALANGIENPRALTPGALLNLSVGAGVGPGGVSLSASATLA